MVGYLNSMSPDEKQMALAIGLLNFGHGIQQANQPGAGFMGALSGGLQSGGNAFMQYPQMLRQQQMEKMKMDLMQNQIEQQKSSQKAKSTLFGGIDPSNGINWETGRQGMADQEKVGLLAQAYPEEYGQSVMRSLFPRQGATPASIQEYEYAKKHGFPGSFEDYKKIGAASSQPAAPIQNFTHRQDLVKKYGENSPEVKTFDNYVRAMPYLNTGPAFVQPGIAGAPNTGNVIATGLKPGEEPAVKGAQAQATAAGKVAGEAGAQAVVELPKVEAAAKQTMELLDALANEQGAVHPGLSGVVGMPNASGLLRIPGTPEADFRARLEQLQGKQFLEAYQTLKGGGQITEVEGNKAQNAIARMQTAQTEEEFKKAVQEFREVLNTGLTRARQKAQQGGAPAAAQPQEFDWIDGKLVPRGQ